MIRFLTFKFLILAALSFGCNGGTKIELSSDRTTISAGNIDSALITAYATLAGSSVESGTKISFETTLGSFSVTSELLSAEVGADANGRAQIELFSPLNQGTATVTASFYDELTGLSATSSITIIFGPPSGKDLPVDGTFRMTCNAVNIGALREPIPDIVMTCNLSAQTRTGKNIPASAFSPMFLAEAGGLSLQTDTYTNNQFVVYDPQKGISTPKDIPPDQSVGEPSYNDRNGRERNPRDGLVTLIAVVDGQEAFYDTNGNTEYDQGETFNDSTEPFLDENDNDQWDLDERYVDANNNGQWDGPNGVWDSQTKIMAIYKVLWTGHLDGSENTSRISSLFTSISNGGQLELTAYALDANMNPVAAFQENQDYFEWTLVSQGDATSNDMTTVNLTNTRGFEFDKTANTERKRWMILSNSFSPPVFKFTVEDGYPQDTGVPTDFTVSARVYVSPGADVDEYYLPQITEEFLEKFQGTCD